MGNDVSVDIAYSQVAVEVTLNDIDITLEVNGSGSGDKTFSQSFTAVSTVTVDHFLAKRPSVTVVDTAGDECEGQVHHTDNNHLTVTFSAPFSGIVTCN